MPAPTYKLIVGLGNPGPEYLFTRHNVGFLVLDAWADEEGEAFHDERARHSKFVFLESGERLVKPMSYMNESGKAVAAWLGHKDGGVLVARTYGHLRDEFSTALAQRMVFDEAQPDNVIDLRQAANR